MLAEERHLLAALALDWDDGAEVLAATRCVTSDAGLRPLVRPFWHAVTAGTRRCRPLLGRGEP